MQLQILEKEDCEKLKMGCYLAVAACSAEPLKFIHLTYKPKGEPLVFLTARCGFLSSLWLLDTLVLYLWVATCTPVLYLRNSLPYLYHISGMLVVPSILLI